MTDPGLQPQRTTLSWTRTAITAAGLTGVLVRHAVRSGAAVDLVATAMAGATALSLLVLARLRRDRIQAAVDAGGSPISVRSIAAVAVLIMATAVALIASFLTDPS
jgi:hypothetical protein